MPNKPSSGPLKHPASAASLKRIFASCDQIQRLAPWEYLSENQVFGLRLEKDGEVNWVNVIGENREVLAVNFYRGEKGLQGLLKLTLGGIAAGEGVEPNPVDLFMNQFMFQTEFVPKADLDSWDRKALKKAGRSLPARHGSMAARLMSFHPGYMPWRLDPDEADLLADLLDAALPILELLSDDPDFCPDLMLDQVPIWTLEEDGNLRAQWESSPGLEDLVMPVIELPELSSDAAGKYRDLPQDDDLEWQMITSPAPGLVEEKGKRPYFPYLTLMCESGSGAVVGMELCHRDSLSSHFTQTVIKALNVLNIRPGRIVVASPPYADALEAVLEEIGVMVIDGECPACDEAFESLEKMMG